MNNIKADILKGLIFSSEENFEIARDIYENFDGIVRDALKASLSKIREKMQELCRDTELIFSESHPSGDGNWLDLSLLSNKQYVLAIGIHLKDPYFGYGILTQVNFDKQHRETLYQNLKEVLGKGQSESGWPWFRYYKKVEERRLLAKLACGNKEIIDDIAREVKENLIDKRDDIERILQEFHRSTDAEESTD